MKRLFFIVLSTLAAASVVLSCTKKEEGEVAVTAVTIDSSLNLVENQEKALTVVFTPSGATGTLVWRSDDPDKVGVANGVVTARAETTEPVGVYALCGTIKSNVCLVTVEKRVEHITGIGFDKSTLTMDQNLPADLQVVLEPATTTDTEFTVDCDQAILTAEISDLTVTLTAKKIGVTDVVVKSVANPSIQGTCTVTVTREMFNPDGTYILYDDMISSNAPMTFGTVNQDASGIGLINGTAVWPEPWWKYKKNDDFLARKTMFALPSNLSDGDLSTCYMTNTDICAPGEWMNEATGKQTGSYGYIIDKIWGKGLEYYGADLYDNWDGNYSDEGFPLVCSTEDLVLHSLVDGHYVQIELPELVQKVDLYIANSQNGDVYFREGVDQVRILLSEDGETFQTLSDAQDFDGGEIDLTDLTYDSDPSFNGKKIKFIRLTHNGTSSMTLDYTASPIKAHDWTVANEGWRWKGGEKLFAGNATPIAFAEIKVKNSDEN